MIYANQWRFLCSFTVFLHGHALSTTTPALWVMKFTILKTLPSSSLLYYQFVRYVPGSKENYFLRNNAISLYDLHGHALAQQPLSQRLRNL